MTEDNQKRLYEHFKATGQKDNMEMMLKAYPHFEEVKEVEVEVEVAKVTKKSGANQIAKS